jgi:hypothetical protein
MTAAHSRSFRAYAPKSHSPAVRFIYAVVLTNLWCYTCNLMNMSPLRMLFSFLNIIERNYEVITSSGHFMNPFLGFVSAIKDTSARNLKCRSFLPISGLDEGTS